MATLFTILRSLYCFVCRLLSKKESPFATSGFNDWKNSNVIVEHENGEEHRKCMTAYLIRHQETGSVDSLYYLNNIAQSRNIDIKC